ncbi:glutamate cyclase domain-containing protein [Falsiroseomonas sp. HW251]|uniref:glutamate cyclase domain-containing protein n=1 Tax=Falsiroseomonas sp. HW251 TaxID=3390998 RepID=UPI003D31E931
MPDITGGAIDQLITIEAKNRGMPHNVLPPMYAAARALVGGRPISMVAAERLRAALGPKDTVLILTGAGYAPTMPKGESDGPPGAASLARALYKGLGAVPVYVNEACHADPVIASSHAAGLMVKSFEEARDWRLGAAMEIGPAKQENVAAWTAALLDRTKPKAVISTERLGPGLDGYMHYATALPLQGPDKACLADVVDISPVVTEASKRGILTIGIGDHGNELGFGAIRDAVVKAMPKGEILCTTVATDIVLPAMMSNWGCYGIEAALAWLLKRPELLHSPAQEGRIIRACLDAGGLEAMYCTTDFVVDNLAGETSMAVLQFLRDIVGKNLEGGTTGLTH